MGYSYVQNYKYLGITVNRNFNTSSHLHMVKEKLSKFKKLMTILKLQGAPGNKMVYFQQIFANSIMDYSSFLYHLQDSNKACIKEFNKLWILCIKSSFNIAKNTPNSQVTTVLNLPTPMEYSAIRFIKVATRLLKERRSQLSIDSTLFINKKIQELEDSYKI